MSGKRVAPVATPQLTSSTAPKKDAQRFINAIANQRNNESVNWARGVIVVAGAAASGIIGVTGSQGFIAYVLLHLLVSAALLAKMKYTPGEYLHNQTSAAGFLLSGLGDNIVMWILVWTFAYALVHFY